MNSWIIPGILMVFAIVLFASVMLGGATAQEGTYEETVSECGPGGCDGSCTATNNCGRSTCGATTGGSCGCGR